MKKHKTILPPAFAQKILLRFLRDDLAEEVLGDLEEKFYTNVKTKSLFKAKMNYWYQVLHYLRPFAIRKSQPAHIISCAMYKSYFKIGWRNLLKNKTYSLINIGGLAFGLAVALLIALWVYDEMSFNKYHKNYETIAKVYRTNDWGEGIETSTSVVVGLGTLLRTEYGSHFKNVVMVRQRVEERIIGFGENKMTQGGYFMQPEGIAMFSLKMLHSSGKEPLRDMMSIVIAESLAKKLFGNIDVINKIVSMDGISDLTVTGVFEDLPRNSEFHGAMFFAPLDLFVGGPNKLNAWDNYNMTIYVQLHMSGQLATVSTAIQNAILPHVDQETADTKPQLFLHPMSDWHLKAHFENGVTVTSEQMRLVWSYCTIGVFVLILACINFMNLSTARSIKRAREVGIRKSIGSLRSQLIQQFFGESLLVSFLSLLAALMMAKFVLPWFNFISDKDLSIPWTTSTFWIAAISFTIITGLFAGSYPALYLSSFNPVKVLKGTFKAGKAASVPRSILVILQFTVSLCLIIGNNHCISTDSICEGQTDRLYTRRITFL